MEIVFQQGRLQMIEVRFRIQKKLVFEASFLCGNFSKIINLINENYHGKA